MALDDTTHTVFTQAGLKARSRSSARTAHAKREPPARERWQSHWPLLDPLAVGAQLGSPMPDEFLTVDEIAQLLKLSSQTIRNWI